MTTTINLKKLLTALMLPMGVFALSVLSSPGKAAEYARLSKPPLAPGAWMLILVWAAVYLLSGLACYIATDRKIRTNDPAAKLYLVFLSLSFLWTPLFFNLRLHVLSLIILILLWLAAFLTMIRFRILSRPAGSLMTPAVIWISYLAYMNIGVVFLN